MDSTTKVSWNTSQGIIMEISNRRSLANTYFIQNNFKKAFSTLISIKHATIQSFIADERTKLNEVEKKFNKIYSFLSSSLSHSFNKKERELNSLANKLAKKYYSEYNDLLMDLLNKYGYLIGEQSDSSRMKF